MSTLGKQHSQSLSTAIVRAIAEAEGTEPVDLSFRLHECINTDVFDALTDCDRDDWTLQFVAGGHEMTVKGDGTIAVDGETYRAAGGLFNSA